MYKFLLPLLFLGSTFLPCVAQNEPVPEYLTTQEFPDSVRTVSVENYNGKGMTFEGILKQYKGKRIVIDIWASWCRDCLVGVPGLRDLIKKTTDQNIVYLFISVDEDERKWKSAISRFSIPGEHFRIKSGWKNPLCNYIVLDWVPRYMVLNETGKVTKSKAITGDMLEKLLVE